MKPEQSGPENAEKEYSVTYTRTTRTLLYCLAMAGFLYWFAAVAVHTHLNETLYSFLTSIPLLGWTLRGDYRVAITGISSMVVLLGAVFALMLQWDVDWAIFNTVLVGSVFTLAYEYWVWAYQNAWYEGRFTILTGEGNYFGWGLTNQFVAGVSASFIMLWVVRTVWLELLKPLRHKKPPSWPQPPSRPHTQPHIQRLPRAGVQQGVQGFPSSLLNSVSPALRWLP